MARWLVETWNAVRFTFGVGRKQNELESEMDCHIGEAVDDLVEQGVRREEARKRVLREFGGVEQIKEDCRDSWGTRMVSDFKRDLTFGLGQLRKHKGFTVVAVATLSLGIGANLTIFNFVNAMLLKPLPYPESEQFAEFQPVHPSFGPMSIAYQNFLDWKEMNESFDEFHCYRFQGFTLTGVDRPERILGMEASADLLSMLGATPHIGRFFGPSDDRAESERTVVLSFAFWQQMYGADPGIVGETVILNNNPYIVIGVLPSGFNFPTRASNPAVVWTPIGLNARNSGFLNRRNHPGINGIGRLKEGMSVDQAYRDLNRITALLGEEYPDSNLGVTMLVDDYHKEIVEDVRPGLVLLSCAVGCLLLIVCVNIAGLLVVRAASRSAEFSFRASLGAGRPRIIRQLMSENFILAVAGGAIGLVLARWGVRFLADFAETEMRFSEVDFTLFDTSGILFFAGIVFMTCLLFGLFPAIQASLSTSVLILSGSRTATAGRQFRRLKDALVVGEVALALVLLSGAGLLVRSYQEYVVAGPGYNPDNTLILNVSLQGETYASDEAKLAFYRKLLLQTRALPELKYAGLCSNLLGGHQDNYRIEGQPEFTAGGTEEPFAEYSRITPGAIEAMGIRLLAGRTFTEFDTAEVGRVALVDQQLARRWWSSSEEALGKRFFDDGELHEIVGVVSHVKHHGVDQNSLDSIYRPAAQMPFGFIRLVARTHGDPMGLVESIRDIIAGIDSNLAVSNVTTLQSIVDSQSFFRRLTMTMLIVFAAAALVLSSIGLYGVASFAASQRTQEFGIRIALGASLQDIRALVIKGGGKLALVGVGIGLLGAFGAGWLIRGLLFGIAPADPLTYLAVTVVIGAVAILASYLPSRQAGKTSPIEALRAE